MLGIDPAALGGRREVVADPAVIWPDMADGFALFVAMQTQWRWTAVGMGAPVKTGLDYGVIGAVAAAADIKMSPGIFSDIRTLEAEALRVWSKGRRG